MATRIGAAVAFSELELKLIDATVGKLCRDSSPPEHRDELRCVYDIDGHGVSVFEERPPWDGSGGDWTRMGVARFRYFRSRGSGSSTGCAPTSSGTSSMTCPRPRTWQRSLRSSMRIVTERSGGRRS